MNNIKAFIYKDMKRNATFKVLLMFIVGLFLSVNTFAQQIVVKGIVKDTTGEPIIGANVIVKGTTNGTITDFDGNFLLNANKGDIIIISFIGYRSQEAQAAASMNIILKDDTELLDEVVVIGYGSVKKDDLSGSVVAIKAEEMNKGAVTSPQELIMGKVPGLANKLCLSSATKVCCNFPETVNNLPKDKAVLTGTPIRQELLHGNKEHARAYCGFTSDKPVLLVIGGSLGAASVNENVRKILPELLKEFQVIHICGKGKTDESIQLTGYVQYEYVQEQLPDMFALADVVISRAGANAICELAALSKPNLLIPLSAKASRGDQILNARSFERQGYSMVLEEEEITEASLLEAIRKLYQERNKYIAAMSAGKNLNSIQHIVNLIEECIHS